MEQYHGTNKNFAINIATGRIDVNRGGGELGKGFYTGDLAHLAFALAWHNYGKDKAVVTFSIGDDDFLNLSPHCLSFSATSKLRKKIKMRRETRTFILNVNAIWAPVVGKRLNNFNQIKYESQVSEDFMNSSLVVKSISK
jgi:hypothetical protein